MGAVYRAHREGVGEVALKTLVGEVTQEERDRFRREAQLLASLRHPAIVPVHTAGEASGLLYFAMGIVEGESLEAKIRREGPLDPEKAVRLLCKIADGVAYANERKIVHRDLKPANVLLDEQGQPLVTDFGLARQLDEKNRLTKTGEIMGTPAFMSPEQAFGRTHEIDERTDVYGLGAILYATLAGRPPFQGGSPFETIKLVRDRDPEPIGGAVPPSLEDFLVRALAKRPEDRPQTAREFARELEEALRARQGISRLVVGLLGVTLVCVLLTGALVWRVLEKRRQEHGDGSASPTPAPVTSASARPNPRLTALLESVSSTIDRSTVDHKAWVSPETLRQLKQESTRVGLESERAQLHAVLARLYEQALSGDAVHFEQLDVAELPLPEDADLRGRIARRWLALAVERSAQVAIDPSAVAMASMKIKSETDVEDWFRKKIVKMKPAFGALARARAADPTLPRFPRELDAFFERTLFGAHIASRIVYEKAWQDAFDKLEDHPIQDLFQAKFAIDALGRELDEVVHKETEIRASALRRLGVAIGDRPPENDPRLDGTFRQALEANPTNEVLQGALRESQALTGGVTQLNEQFWTRALESAERLLKRLDPNESPVVRDLAEMVLFEVVRHIIWLREPERVVALLEGYSKLVSDGSKEYSSKFAAAASAFTRQNAKGWGGADAERIRLGYDEVCASTLNDHDRHLGEITQSLTNPSEGH